MGFNGIIINFILHRVILLQKKNPKEGNIGKEAKPLLLMIRRLNWIIGWTELVSQEKLNLPR